MIKGLTTRYPEIGRIRLGEKGAKGQPVKGQFLRFSSSDELVLQALASQLGGEVVPWPEGEQEWQLTTESASVDVLLPPEPIDTSYERWGKGGIQRRCDGERCLAPVVDGEGGYMAEDDCACLAEGLTPGDRGDMKKGACQVTVRLRLVLPSVPGLGVWLCTSHSWYAALELPGQVELLQAIAGKTGALIPASFAIEAREEKKPWEKFRREYIVPVLRVRASLMELGAGAAPVAALGTGSGSTTNGPTGQASVDRAPRSEAAPEMITSPQLRKLHAVLGERGIKEAKERHATLSEITGRAVTSANDLTKVEAVKVIDTLESAPAPARPRSATAPSPFVRTVGSALKRAGLEGEEADAFVRYVCGIDSLAALSGPEQGNSMMAAAKRFDAGEIVMSYDADGAPTFAERASA